MNTGIKLAAILGTMGGMSDGWTPPRQREEPDYRRNTYSKDEWAKKKAKRKQAKKQRRMNKRK